MVTRLYYNALWEEIEGERFDICELLEGSLQARRVLEETPECLIKKSKTVEPKRWKKYSGNFKGGYNNEKVYR